MVLKGSCDADWALDLDDRRSTSGFYIYLVQLVSWLPKEAAQCVGPVLKLSYKEASQNWLLKSPGSHHYSLSYKAPFN